MKPPIKILIVAALAVTVVAAVALKQGKNESKDASAAAALASPPADASSKAGLPRLVDLGAGKCIPCKKMAPILEELKKEYAGRMEVEFIDVWKNPAAGKAYGVEMIPTQIFYDGSGKELGRHTGFFGKEDILAKWKELGVELATVETK
ncbi:MAG: thioredoxin family protein [Verrucomicrobiota bacterium]